MKLPHARDVDLGGAPRRVRRATSSSPSAGGEGSGSRRRAAPAIAASRGNISQKGARIYHVPGGASYGPAQSTLRTPNAG